MSCVVCRVKVLTIDYFRPKTPKLRMANNGGNDVVEAEAWCDIEATEPTQDENLCLAAESSVATTEENNEIENDEAEQEFGGSISHFRNRQAHSPWLRYGIPIYLLCTLALLLASDIGSGVEANYILRGSDGSVFEERTLLTASIFSSVKELWNSGSYPLALLIVVTSIAWPYLKLIFSMAAWTLPSCRSVRCRERFIEVVDALGKWSFVDIFVLLIIMVAFRSTIPLGFGGEI